MRGGFPSCSGPRGECGGSDRATNRWIDTDCGPRPWKERANQITGGRGIYLTGPVSCGNLRPRIKRTAGREPRLFERDLGNCAASKTPGTERRRPFSFIFYFSQSSNTLPSHPSPWNRGRKKECTRYFSKTRDKFICAVFPACCFSAVCRAFQG